MSVASSDRAHVVNVAPYKHGISYGNGWTHVDGWSSASSITSPQWKQKPRLDDSSDN